MVLDTIKELVDEMNSTGIIDILGVVIVLSGVVASLSVLGPIHRIPIKDIPLPLAIIMILVGLFFIAEGRVGDIVLARQALVDTEEDEADEGEDEED
ncbi:MAG: hypothetical protein SVU32_04575 [Candidatus Nanohaloarchaea archaeon]|nr:hypothetical protein [Candidatus Nanohaloarchaea archaeon]